MSVSVCIVIPIYNHKDAIGATLARLVGYGLPIIVVDDGSDDATRGVLAELAAKYAPQLTLLRLPVNGGKGAAVMAGLRAACRAGHSHALQIDADGQHDAADVPVFVEAAQRAPDAMVTGRPVYDDSVPKARLYGRYVTHVWVWIETLSFEIRDSMCGFRVYPLAATCQLIDDVALPTRMDFDIEILVRLHWRGLPFVQIPTRVTYAVDGLSHFDALHDNLRISRSHTRLVFGMLMRAPLLLARKLRPRRGTHAQTDGAQPWWRVAERGSHLGMRLLALSCRVFGPRFTSLWLYPIVAYFLATGRAQRAASRAYFERLAAFAPDGSTPRPGWRTSYRHMLAFAQASFDKYAAWLDPGMLRRVRMNDRRALDTLDALVASGRGALVIGSHLGNLEMARALVANSGRKTVTAVIHTEHARRFNHMLARASSQFRQHLVEVGDFGPETAMMMEERIARGELLVIVGDRAPVREHGGTTATHFLGAPAEFPQGPFVLAHALQCPVYLYFCLKTDAGYQLHFEPFAERIDLPRKERAQRLAEWTRRYAARLEHYCLLAPYQWFNFYDFWKGAAADANDQPIKRSTTPCVPTAKH